MNHHPPTNTPKYHLTGLPEIVRKFIKFWDRGLDSIEHLPGFNTISLLMFLCFASVLIGWNLFLANVMITSLNMNDFGKFYFSIVAYINGKDMYGPNPATLMEVAPGIFMHLWNLNPPHFHVLLYPLGYLSPHMALMVWAGMNYFAGLCSLLIIAKSYPANPAERHRRLIFLSLLSFSGTSILFATAQLSLLLLLPLTLAWIELRNGNWRRGALFLGFVCSIKPFLLIFVPYFFLKRQYFALVNFFMAIGVCYLIGYLLFGKQIHLEWIEVLMAINWHWTNLNGSIFGFLSRSLSQNPIFATVISAPDLITPIWFLLAGVITTFTCWVLYFDTTPQSVDRAIMLLLFAALLVSPLGWQYYVFFTLGPLSTMIYYWRSDSARVISSKDRFLKIGRTTLLYMALPGMLFPFMAVHLYQPNWFATVTVGSIYFWSILCLWTSGILDGFLEKGRLESKSLPIQPEPIN